MRSVLMILALLMLSGDLRAAQALAFEQHEHLQVALRSDHVSVAPGQRFQVGLHFVHDPGWHTYWINPGDSGLETRLQWRLPEAWQAGDVQWPWPSRYEIAHLVNHGYGGELLLPIAMQVPEHALPGTDIDLEVNASWLVCEVECIPGSARLSLPLKVAAQEQAAGAELQALFAQAQARQPELREDWQAQFSVDDRTLRIHVRGALEALQGRDIESFPVQTQLAANGGRATISLDGDSLIWEHQRSDYFTGAPETMDLVLVATDGNSEAAYQLRAQRTDAPLAAAATSAGSGAAPPPGGALITLQYLLLAMAGGMLLNLMPCVFPVLSFKALGLMQSAGSGKAMRHGLLYTLGVLLSFAALGALLLVLRAGGESLGWGFQLQSPLLVGLLAYLMLVLGLSLSGLVNVGGSLMGLGSSLSSGQGDRSAFFTGVLACVVASPCTAPLMGGALGFALTQPPLVAMSVFVALGLGMALPLLALSCFPSLARYLPAPGAWMETVKQFLAFPLYLTAIWLAWVYGSLAGVNGMAVLLIGMLGLALALWLWPQLGHSHSPAWAGTRRGLSAASAVLALALLTPSGERLLLGDRGVATAELRWEAWSPEHLQALRAEGRPVLVNMTAAWCITCLANERVALSSEDFTATLEETGVVYLKGDWTRQDDVIAEYLASYGRSGVPLYVVYPRDGGEGRVLPQVLTPALVRDALRSL